MLERVVTLAEENNHILRGIRRTNNLGLIWKICYWTVIIGMSVGAYVYIQPYIGQMTKIYDQVRGTVDSVKGLSGVIPKF